ncbi:MAG: hypothetical protein H6810_12105 [Phycisphaeraceae bacterium]|nr:MAG: hypothetical protein H6810_12105 [Phycisphaeraceae bacterium]
MGAGFGSAVAISADGTVALVGGSGFDLGDGVVRSFTKQNGEWVEGTGFRGGAYFGEVFGYAIAMNAAGDLAAISAPYQFNEAPFVPQAGVVDIWERDPQTGEWSRTDRIWDPDPGFRYNFGASVDITPDGNTLVIGRAALLGTETDPLPDATFVVRRIGGTWGAPVELLPDVPPDNLDQFGFKVAINDAGDVIAVGAPGNTFSDGSSGEIYIFRRAGDTWLHAETLTRLTPGMGFNLFGSAFAISGDEIFATDPARGLYGGDINETPDLLIYDGSDGAFGPDPDQILRVPAMLTAYGFGPGGLGRAMAIRGDIGLIGAPNSTSITNFAGYAGAAFRIEREEGVWTFTSRLEADDPTQEAYFASGIALDAAASEYVIGEPGYTPDFDHYGMGRVHFTNQVFRDAPFTVVTAESSLSLELLFPGVPIQVLEFFVGGSLDFLFPENCDDADPLSQIRLVGGRLTTTDKALIEFAPGMSVMISSISLSVNEPLPPALLDQNGDAMFEDVVLTLEGDIEFFGVPIYHATEPVTIAQFPLSVSGTPAGGLSVSVPQFSFDPQIDVGPDVVNPTMNATLRVTAIEANPPCNTADFAEPFGLLDLADVLAFVVAFQAGDPAADLGEPLGLFDLADVLAFVVQFNAGCP